MQPKKNNNTLKKILCSDDKNTQRVHNKYCTGRKSHLSCHFIILILTRTGLHNGLYMVFQGKRNEISDGVTGLQPGPKR